MHLAFLTHTVLEATAIENVQNSVNFPNETTVANTSFSSLSGAITIPVKYLQEVAQGLIKEINLYNVHPLFLFPSR